MLVQVVNKLRSNETWQDNVFIDKMEQPEEGTDEEVDATIKLTIEAPANIQDQVFSRWGTVLAALRCSLILELSFTSLLWRSKETARPTSILSNYHELFYL